MLVLATLALLIVSISFAVGTGFLIYFTFGPSL